MDDLTELLKEDLKTTKTLIYAAVKGSVVGVATPFVIKSGTDYINRDCNESELERKTSNAFQIIGATISSSGLSFMAIQQNTGGFYIATLALTNAIDYLKNK